MTSSQAATPGRVPRLIVAFTFECNALNAPGARRSISDWTMGGTLLEISTVARTHSAKVCQSVYSSTAFGQTRPRNALRLLQGPPLCRVANPCHVPCLLHSLSVSCGFMSLGARATT